MFNDDYDLSGKHASILKFFVNDAKMFSLYIDVYKCAAIFGLLYGRKADKDTAVKDRANILASAFNNHRSDCVFLYRLTMLLERSTDATTEERVDRAFRDDADEEHPEKLKANMELFNAYVRGGLEVMQEQLLDGCTSEEDYMRRTYEKFMDFKRQLSGTDINPLEQLD